MTSIPPPACDEPKESCAAKCLTLRLLGESFRPEFTHQIFAGEYIPGYRPPPTSTTASHPSFRFPATHELSIYVELNPSCAGCALSIEANPMKRLLYPPQKRVKLEPVTDGCVAHSTTQRNENDVNDSTVRAAESCAVEKDPLLDRLTVSDIRNRLQPYLPPIHTFNGEATGTSTTSEYLSAPFGIILNDYSCRGMNFCLSLSDGTECADYHHAVQGLAVYFIESADHINVSDPSWKVLYLFRQHAQHQFSLAGYVTLYAFDSPFRKPTGGTIVRICQAVVLPPYQRAGHGSRMVHAVFDWVNQSNGREGTAVNIVEVNVEDPAPAFALLRLVVDYERFVHSGRSWFDHLKAKNIHDADSFAPLKDADALLAALPSKTTTRQVHCVYELEKLSQLFSLSESHGDLEKKFRLLVKQRLNKENREELSACSSKKEAQSLLGTMFDAIYRDYQTILERVKSS